MAILLYAMLHDIADVPTEVFADEQIIGLSATDAVEHSRDTAPYVPFNPKQYPAIILA